MDEKIEHQGLDPWVQWVSIHSGKPLKEHNIKRLGDTKNKIAIRFGIQYQKYLVRIAELGVMNAPCGNKSGISFVPDPWSLKSKHILQI